MKHLLREPLIHFLLIGAALFAVYRFTQPARDPSPASREIRLSPDELTQLILLFQAQWKRQPTPPEFDRLVENKVESEVLYREALALGLDQNYEIGKRLMAQKMQFLTEGITDPFMFQDYYRDRAPDYLGREFGPQFAQAVVKLSPGSWQGPVESGFGWHLVFVDTVSIRGYCFFPRIPVAVLRSNRRFVFRTGACPKKMTARVDRFHWWRDNGPFPAAAGVWPVCCSVRRHPDVCASQCQVTGR